MSGYRVHPASGPSRMASSRGFRVKARVGQAWQRKGAWRVRLWPALWWGQEREKDQGASIIGSTAFYSKVWPCVLDRRGKWGKIGSARRKAVEVQLFGLYLIIATPTFGGTFWVPESENGEHDWMLDAQLVKSVRASVWMQKAGVGCTI